MSRIKTFTIFVVTLAVLFSGITAVEAITQTGLLMVDVAYAQATGYTVSWWTVDGGGGASGGNSYTLTGTIGQVDAGQSIGSSDYTLSGGFWFSSTQHQYQVYLPLVLR